MHRIVNLLPFLTLTNKKTTQLHKTTDKTQNMRNMNIIQVSLVEFTKKC